MKLKTLFGSLTTAAILATTLMLPPRQAEAQDGAAYAIIGGIAGLIIGSEIERSNQCQQRCQQRQRVQQQRQRAWNQRMIMRDVLSKYHPANHDYFVEYVMCDLEGWLKPEQQRHLLYVLEQRRQAAVAHRRPAPQPPVCDEAYAYPQLF